MSILNNAPIAHDDGHFINAKVTRIVELIREYDPRLDVAWIPPENRAPNEPAFAIVENTVQGPVVAFYVQDEQSFDENILKRIYEADVTKNDIQGRLEAHNRAVKALRAKEQEDERMIEYEFLHSFINSPLHTYKHNGRKLRK